MSEVICYHCKKPITSRKEFGMAVAEFGFRLEPFHISCWAIFQANASLGRRLVMSPWLKLTADTEKGMRLRRKQVLIVLGIVFAIYFILIMGSMGLQAFGLILISIAGFGSFFGGIFAFANWMNKDQNKQWNEAIILIPEQESA